jgi:translation elongation factor EF-Ts
MPKLTYRIIKKGLFESIEKFEGRINDLAAEGWIAVSISSENSNAIVVLMKKETGN